MNNNRKNKVSKQLLNDLRVQLYSIRLDLKPSYLWEISFGDCDHVFDVCKQFEINLNGLKVIEINGLLFISDINSLLRHLNQLLADCFESFIDVSPGLQSPQLLSKQQIKSKKTILNDLFNEFKLFSTEDKTKYQINNPSFSDLCLICGSLLGYPVIYVNNNSDEGNCLSLQPLIHYSIDKNSNQTIYSFSCPQMYGNLFDHKIKLWFKSLEKTVEDLNLREEIKTLPLILT